MGLSLKSRPLSGRVITKLGTNVAAEPGVSQKGLESRPVAHLGARRDVGGSPNIAVEAIMMRLKADYGIAAWARLE